VWAPSGSVSMLLGTSGNAQRHCNRLSGVGLLVDYLAFAIGVLGGGGTWKVTPRSSFCLRVASKSRSVKGIFREWPRVKSINVGPTMA
jgi:hypothetical protein